MNVDSNPAALETPVIVAAARTPVGKFLGSLASLPAPRLGAVAVREAVRRAGLQPGQVEECILGQVVQAGAGQNPARQAALFAGLSPSVAAMTLNKVCGSGLKAVALAAQSIRLGEARFVVAGGMESMSNCPYLLPGARQGWRLGHAQAVDAMIQDGLWDVYENFHMGETAELVSERYRVSREDQDEFALGSHRKAVAAIQSGRFQAEIVPVEVPGKKGVMTEVLQDEGPRPDTSLEALRQLKPVFRKNGAVTAGNAPGTNDGAAAVVVAAASALSGISPEAGQPRFRIVAQAVSGIEPKWVMMAPVEAVRKLWQKTGWQAQDADLYELNEAFAAQALAVMRELQLDPARVNVNGGAVALGHPIGASGARILVTLLFELQRRQARRGIAALCLGGGNAVALAVEAWE